MPQDIPDPSRIIPDVPAGKMRVWDAEQKKVILVSAPTSGQDRITLSLRVHDAREKLDAAKSSGWATVQVDRADLTMPQADFLQKYVVPALGEIKLLQLTLPQAVEAATAPAPESHPAEAGASSHPAAADASAQGKPSP